MHNVKFKAFTLDTKQNTPARLSLLKRLQSKAFFFFFLDNLEMKRLFLFACDSNINT